MQKEPLVPDPLDMAQLVIAEQGWGYDVDGGYLYAEVKGNGAPYDISISNNEDFRVLFISCDMRRGGGRRIIDEQTEIVLRCLITELNEGLPFGSFSYRSGNQLLGFCHALLTMGVQEHVLSFQIQETISRGIYFCATASSLFEHVFETGTPPKKELIRLFAEPDEGEA